MNIVVIEGLDATATTRAALRLARSESSGRDVIVADLWGDLPELEQLAGDHDIHGVSDVLLFGVSLSRVTRRVSDDDRLFVITSGNDVVARQPLLESDRWDSIFDQARANASLLVLVCRGDTPGIESLTRKADAVISPRSMTPSEELRAQPGPDVQRAPPESGQSPADTAHNAALPRDVHRWPMILLLVLTGVGALLLFFSGSGKSIRDSVLARLSGRASVAATLPADSSPDVPAPRILNPRDSAQSSMYAVEIAVLNTRAGADMRLAELSDIPGSTISPVASSGGDTWYRVLAGALTTRERAAALQSELRARELQFAEGDRIVRLPIALRLGMYPPDHEASAVEGLARYISLGIPAYLLAQNDGSLLIFAGAFENAEQARGLGEICAGKGISPRYVYRTGR